MILAIAAALAIAEPSPLRPADVAGTYVTSQMETAGALELRSDGHFRYELDYGAVSESAEGEWSLDGTGIRLTSNPMPVPPDFTVVRDDPAPAGELYVALENAGFSWSPIDMIVQLEGEETPIATRAEAGGKVAIPSQKRATSIRILVPVYRVASTPVKLSVDRGHRLLFRLEPNDLGKAAFRGEPLVIDGSSMIMNRYDTEFVFRRAAQSGNDGS